MSWPSSVADSKLEAVRAYAREHLQQAKERATFVNDVVGFARYTQADEMQAERTARYAWDSKR